MVPVRTRSTSALRWSCALACALLCALPAGARAQAGGDRQETVTYASLADSMPLSAILSLPEGPGPFPAVVVTSLAGLDDLVARLNGDGWAVLMPERRGIRTIEHLLRATFEDLALDVESALAYMRTRPDVDARVVGLLAQGGETMAGVLAGDAEPAPAFVILLATTGLPGDETFRIEQHVIGADRSFDAEHLAELDEYVLKLTQLVVREPSPGLRAFGVRALQAEHDIVLPNNAAFPPDPEDQVRFFASAWWRELFLFRPDEALARLRSPVLVLMGLEDQLVPYTRQLAPVTQALERAPAEDATACLIGGRIQHSFTPESLELIAGWLGERLGRDGFAARPQPPPDPCIDPPR